MIFYTADLHFGHERIIELCRRPFRDAEEMDRVLIERWNERVSEEDVVYILGDLIYRASPPYERYLETLRGRKRLILGNHDSFWTSGIDLPRYFESVSRLDVIDTEFGRATLCHYPMMDYEGDYLLYGHLHETRPPAFWETLAAMPRAFNVGADVNDFRPVTLDELIDRRESEKSE